MPRAKRLLACRSTAARKGLACVARRRARVEPAATTHCLPAHGVAVSRDMLAQCRPIAQLDRKFILALVPGPPVDSSRLPPPTLHGGALKRERELSGGTAVGSSANGRPARADAPSRRGKRKRRSSIGTPTAQPDESTAGQRHSSALPASRPRPRPHRQQAARSPSGWAAPLLLAIDQHAADERIRLELLQQLLRSQFVSPGPAGTRAASGRDHHQREADQREAARARVLHLGSGEREVLAPQSGAGIGRRAATQSRSERVVGISESDRRAIAVAAPYLRRWGWQFSLEQTGAEGVHTGGRGSRSDPPEDSVARSVAVPSGGPASGAVLRLREAPSVLGRALVLDDLLEMARGMQREAARWAARRRPGGRGGRDRSGDGSAGTGSRSVGVSELLGEEEELAVFRSGSASSSGVHRCLANRACREAVKFYDPLEWKQAAGLAMELASCQLPFQCAHGRPSLVPIAQIASVGGAGRGGLLC